MGQSLRRTSDLHIVEEVPQLTKLGPGFVGAAFTCMKLIPARYILDQAEARGELQPGATIVESTSGTFGLAVAMLGAFRGYKVILVGDTAIDPYLEARLRGLGARIDRIDPESTSTDGPQVQRVKQVKSLLESIPGSYWPRQYDNLDNIASYAALARRLVKELGRIDFLVGTVGTGGSMSGTGLAMRALLPSVQVVGVDTHNSVLFGHPPGNRLLRGLGNSLIPANVRHELFDQIHWVTAAEAYAATNDLHREHALFMGGTSGAAYLVGRWIKAMNPDAQVVALLPDPGHRYVDTIYNPEWLASLPGWVDGPSIELKPRAVTHPTEIMDRWSFYDWGRRPLSPAAPAAPSWAPSPDNFSKGETRVALNSH